MNRPGKKINRLVSRFAGGLAAALICLAGTGRSQTNDEPPIVFLHLQLRGESVRLIESCVRPGRLKPRLDQEWADGLHFELTDREGRVLWQGAMENPRVRRIEQEDPPGSGRLKRKQINLADPEFVVRVPRLAEAQRIEFYTLTPDQPGKPASRKSLGKLPLPGR